MKPGVQSHRDLLVWQRGMDLAVASYNLTKAFPRDEMYGLVAQIRRSSVSIPSNIAEGYGREVSGSFIQHLRIAQGSLKELETHVMLSERLEFCGADISQPHLSGCDELGKMLRALIRSIQETS